MFVSSNLAFQKQKNFEIDLKSFKIYSKQTNSQSLFIILVWVAYTRLIQQEVLPLKQY